MERVRRVACCAGWPHVEVPQHVGSCRRDVVRLEGLCDVRALWRHQTSMRDVTLM
jgi:hypothetical protein